MMVVVVVEVVVIVVVEVGSVFVIFKIPVVGFMIGSLVDVIVVWFVSLISVVVVVNTTIGTIIIGTIIIGIIMIITMFFHFSVKKHTRYVIAGVLNCAFEKLH